MTFNYIDVGEKQFVSDGKGLKAFKEMRKKLTFFKPNKKQCSIVKTHCTNCVEVLLSDQNKPKHFNINLITMRLKTVAKLYQQIM